MSRFARRLLSTCRLVLGRTVGQRREGPSTVESCWSAGGLVTGEFNRPRERTADENSRDSCVRGRLLGSRGRAANGGGGASAAGLGSRRSRSTTARASRWASPCCPDRRVLHTARTGEVRIHDPRDRAEHARRRRSPSTSTTRRACKASPSTRTSAEQAGSTSTTRRRSTRRWTTRPPRRQRGRRAVRRAPTADFAPFQGVMRLSRFKLDGDTLDLDTEQEIIDVPVDRGICCHVGGADRLRQRRATCTSRPGTTRTRSSPTATRRSTSAPDRNPAFDAQTQLWQHERPARQAAAHQRRRPVAATRSPPGNLFRAGHARRPGPRSTRWACATRSASR